MAAVVALSGATIIAVALASQHGPAQPPLSSASPSAPSTSGPPAPSTTPAPEVVGPVLAASPPVSLSIPAISVQSMLLPLGQTPAGALEVPPPGPHYDEAGWYRYSPTPGEIGPAVIAGHVDSAANGPSVFFRLGGLKPNDTVLVAREDGSVALFAVQEVRRYHKADFPTEVVYGNTNRAALRLITCGGPFDRSTGHYVDNIVVLADLVGAQSPSGAGPSPPQARSDRLQ